MSSSLPGYILLALLAGIAFATVAWPRAGAWWQGRIVFAIMTALTVVAAHAPALNHPHGLANPDEGLLLAAALTLRHDFAPWLSVDLSTAGPLSVVPLLAAPATFSGARWCAALCSAAAVSGTFLALTQARDQPAARILTPPVAAFLVFTQNIEFLQFSTEHVAIVLLAAATWIWVTASRGGEASPRAGAAFVLGTFLGATVLAKPQSAPCAAWLAAATGVLLLLDTRTPWPGRVRVLVAQIGGCILVPAAFTLLAWWQGALPDFWHGYGLNNFQYMSTIPHDGAAGYQPAMIWGLNYLLKPVFAVCLLCLAALPAFSVAERRVAVVGTGLLLSAIVAVVLPGRGFGHYWFYLLGPLLFASGSLLAPALRCVGAFRPRWATVIALAAGGLLLAAPVVHRLPSGRDLTLAPEFAHDQSVQSAGQQLRELARPGDRLVVWGWRPELHVYSQLPQGTRDASSQWQIQDIPQRAYYRRRYLSDLARNRPRFIADVVGPHGFGFRDRAVAGPESFPEFANLIATDYAPAGEIDGIRLYARIDR